MTGSALDGEDIMQEALFEAYRKIEQLDDAQALRPWLFRIAHNRCIDFLRRRGVQSEAETLAMSSDVVDPVEATGPALGRAVEHLVTALPPKERACVLLKDVFDYTLDEIAELVDSTVGGVKSALSRGRAKLASLPKTPPAAAPEVSPLLRLYVDRFNRRDWDGLRELISADARLQVADRYAGRLVDSPYFSRYDGRAVMWRMAAGFVDGEAAVVALIRDAVGWTPRAVVRLEIAHDRVVGVSDYTHCPWLIPAAIAFDVSAAPAEP
jgi:RNA polymerase sigma-70 factor (ECF subfamily)